MLSRITFLGTATVLALSGLVFGQPSAKSAGPQDDPTLPAAPPVEIRTSDDSYLTHTTYSATLSLDGAVAAGVIDAGQAVVVAAAAAEAAARNTSDSLTIHQSTGTAPESISANSGECAYREALLPTTDPAWGGNDPAAGSLVVNICNGPTTYLYVPNPPAAAAAAAAPAPPPPPDPAVLARQAYGELSVPAPTAHRSPSETNSDPDHGGLPFTIVGLRTSFWVADWQPVQRTVELRGVSVTLTATPVEIRFDPGNGDSAVSCAGPGRAWTPADRNAAPTNGGCAYTYTRVSLDGPLTATTSVQWQVDWTSNAGAGGTFPDGVSQVSDSLLVEQIQVVVR